MKKLFVSVPMKGRTDEAIDNSIDKMHKIAELVFGEELEVIPTHLPPKAPKKANKSIWCLGRSIQKLAEADYFIGVSYTGYFNGCNVERDVARHYRIKSCNVYMDDCEFLKDALELENNSYYACCEDDCKDSKI